MAVDATIAHPAHLSTTEPQPEYFLRGLGLLELHGEEILRSYQGGGHYLIPSGTEANRLYEVRVGVRPERSRCECVGFGHHRHCSHVVCATLAHKKSAVCDGCGRRFRHRDLVEVQESLTYFEGDLLCYGCAAGSDADVL
jgi:hypothetical protein